MQNKLFCLIMSFLICVGTVEAAQSQYDIDRNPPAPADCPSHGGERVKFQVVDVKTQIPLTGYFIDVRSRCEVNVAGQNESFYYRYSDVNSVTNQRGESEIQGLSKKNHKFTFQAKGYEILTLDLDIPTQETVKVALEPAVGTISGRVFNWDKTPLSGVAISLDDGIHLKNGENKTFSDENGRFIFKNVRRKPDDINYYALSFNKDGFDIQENRILDMKFPETIISDIRLVKTIKLHGRLLDKNKKPIAGGRIDLVPEKSYQLDNFWNPFNFSKEGHDVYGVGVGTDQEGEFKIESIMPGKYILVYGEMIEKPISLKPGDDVKLELIRK